MTEGTFSHILVNRFFNAKRTLSGLWLNTAESVNDVLLVFSSKFC